MGIEGFFYNFIRGRNKGALGTLVENGIVKGKPAKKIRGVCVDINGMIHSIAQQTFMYGDEKIFKLFTERGLEFFKLKKQRQILSYNELVKEFLENFTLNLNNILQFYDPYEFIVLAVDGIPPNAKVFQQRSRRFSFKTAEEEEKEIVQEDGEVGSSGVGKINLGPALAGFHSSFISPGTPLMKELHEHIEIWVRKNVKNFPPKFFYTSHETEGEGEHKIFEFLREKIFTSHDTERFSDPTIIWGLDNDLIILSMLSPLKNIFLARESFDEQLNIEPYKEIIVNELMLRNDVEIYQNINDQERRIILQDFSVLISLMGNDFIPKNPLYKARDNAIQNIFYSYFQTLKKLRKNLTTVNSELNKNFLFEFFNNLFLEEPNLIKRRASIESSTQGSYFNINKFFQLDGSYEDKQKLVFEESERIYNKVNQVPDSLVNLLRTKYDEEKTQNVLNSNQFPYDTLTTLVSKTESEEIYRLFSFREKMIANYVDIIEWVLRYYTLGGKGINWDFTYPYFFAPWSKSIGDFEHFYSKNQISKKRAITQDQGNFEARGKTSLNFALHLVSIFPNDTLKEAFTTKAKSKLFHNYLSLTETPNGVFEYISNVQKSLEVYDEGVPKNQSYLIKNIFTNVNFSLIKEAIDILETKRNEKNIESQKKKIEQLKRKALEEGMVYQKINIRPLDPILPKELTRLKKDDILLIKKDVEEEFKFLMTPPVVEGTDDSRKSEPSAFSAAKKQFNLLFYSLEETEGDNIVNKDFRANLSRKPPLKICSEKIMGVKI